MTRLEEIEEYIRNRTVFSTVETEGLIIKLLDVVKAAKKISQIYDYRNDREWELLHSSLKKLENNPISNV